MLNLQEAARLPESIRFTRNGWQLEARRERVGELEVARRAIRVADTMYDAVEREKQPGLPLRPPDGTYPVHAYVWAHPCGPVNVCVVVTFRRQRLALARRLAVRNEWRPDLTEGVIADNGNLIIWSNSAVSFKPGHLGVGCFPVAGVFNFGLSLQAIVIDFLVWKDDRHRIVLLPGWEFDEFGILRDVQSGKAFGF